MGKIINAEMGRRGVAICFNCGAVFEDGEQNSTCPDCGNYLDTRWLTRGRTWLVKVEIERMKGEMKGEQYRTLPT